MPSPATYYRRRAALSNKYIHKTIKFSQLKQLQESKFDFNFFFHVVIVFF